MVTKEYIDELIEGTVSDLLYYDRKEDEDCPMDAIEKSIEEGVFTKEEMVQMFEKHLAKGLEK